MRVLGQVVEFDFAAVLVFGLCGDVFLVGEDEFPIPINDPAVGQVGAWFVNVHGVMQVAGAVGRLALGQGLIVEEVDTLHGIGRFEAARFEDGRREVDAVGQLGAILRFHLAGPTDHDGGAEAAIVLGALGTRGVAAVVSALNPAVVGDVNHDGVLSQFFLVEMIEQLAAGFVEPFAHGPVTGDEFGLGFFCVLVEQALGRIVRSVGEERGVPDEKRFFTCILDEVKNLVHPFASDL